MSEFVRLEVADGVGTIRLDRPKMNALNVQVQEEIRAAAAEATERDDVAAVVVYGGERVFAAGADIKEMADMSYTDMVERSGALQSAFTAVARIPKPVVAAITGYALGGGCELALCADFRFAADERRSSASPRSCSASSPAPAAPSGCTRLVGPSKAKDLIFTGRFVKADEALAIGLVDRVVPAPTEVYDEAVAWAEQFAGAATYALRAAKESIDRGLEVDLDTGLEIERQQFAALFATEDRTIGMGSFVENGPGQGTVRGPVSRLSGQGVRHGGTTATAADRAPATSRQREHRRSGRVSRSSSGCSSCRCAVPGHRRPAGRPRRQPRQRAGAASSSTAPTPSTSASSPSTTAIKEFTGENAETKNALFNWGLGAVVWLVVGRILERVIRPDPATGVTRTRCEVAHRGPCSTVPDSR